MITLALDTATDRCTVAASDGNRDAERHLDGARQHATSIVQLIDEVLQDLGAAPRDITRIVLADGPGSFTGLRVSTAVAKALAWQRQVEWYVAPSLMVRAFAHAPDGGGSVVALADALRGEVYAGCWSITPAGIVPIGAPVRAMTPDDLAAFGPVDVVVGSVPDALCERVRAATGHDVIGGVAALPDARLLIRLAATAGGAIPVADIATWEPDYGRPAEAQAVWERKHGRALPASISVAR